MASEDIKKYKIIFLGDQGVGKSSVLNRFSSNTFNDDYQATVGLDFHSKSAVIGGANVRLLLYDTAGQEKFKSLIPMYIRDANIIIVIYDISNKATFEHSNNWIKETFELKREDAIFVIVGNKMDLETSRQVSYKEGEDFAKAGNYLFTEVSAKTGENIQELFVNIIFPEMEKRFNISEGGAPEPEAKDEVSPGQNGPVVIGGGGESQESIQKGKGGGCCGAK